MVLQRGDVVVPNRKICPRVDLVPEKERKKYRLVRFLITARNEVAARQCFYTCVSFC